MAPGEDRLLNIGYIGCGRNATRHMQQATASGRGRVRAVCDLTSGRAAECAERYGAQECPDYRRLLELADLDAVTISIPPRAHGEIELAVIERGLPFLVEKPVALDLETARRIEDAVLRSGLLVSVGYQLRYLNTVDQAREILQGQEAGMAVGRYWIGTGLQDDRGWLVLQEQSGGQIVEQATHTVDLMRYFYGDVDEVYTAAANRVVHDMDCADFQVMTLRFRSGALGSLTTSWAYVESLNEVNRLDLLFEGGRIIWSPREMSVLRSKAEQKFMPAQYNIDAAFLQAVEENRPDLIRSTYSDALRTLKVTLASNLSAREQRPVKLSELDEEGFSSPPIC